MTGMWPHITVHWLSSLTIAGLSVGCVQLRRQATLQAAERWRERRMREELEAYARLDASTSSDDGDVREAQKSLARRVCRLVAEKSVFLRVAMLMRDVEGHFKCMGSVGVDDLTLAALHQWAAELEGEERGEGKVTRMVPSAWYKGAKSFAINLGEWKDFDPEVASWAMSGRKERRRWRRGLVAPIRTGAGEGRMVGALAVCADGAGLDGWLVGLDKAMGPVEALAAKLSRTMENEAMAERLLRAEKLAGLGQLAGGVAHALNNPLTAVLGFAELIAETAQESRVRKDAGTIAMEALKMKATVERLVEFWRPVTLVDEPVDLAAVLRELETGCRGKLQERGVALELVGWDATVPAVRGSRDRLRQVMEHLLNNAAQSIAGAPLMEDELHGIRVTASFDERALHVIVSDTGPGFREPGRVFDPFYTTKGPEQGAGLGLSICYGIVREHGGEISAFNLHPRGAAVVVELPVRKAVRQEKVVVIREGLRA